MDVFLGKNYFFQSFIDRRQKWEFTFIWKFCCCCLVLCDRKYLKKQNKIISLNEFETIRITWKRNNETFKNRLSLNNNKKKQKTRIDRINLFKSLLHGFKVSGYWIKYIVIPLSAPVTPVCLLAYPEQRTIIVCECD